MGGYDGAADVDLFVRNMPECRLRGATEDVVAILREMTTGRIVAEYGWDCEYVDLAVLAGKPWLVRVCVGGRKVHAVSLMKPSTAPWITCAVVHDGVVHQAIDAALRGDAIKLRSMHCEDLGVY